MNVFCRSIYVHTDFSGFTDVSAQQQHSGMLALAWQPHNFQQICSNHFGLTRFRTLWLCFSNLVIGSECNLFKLLLANFFLLRFLWNFQYCIAVEVTYRIQWRTGLWFLKYIIIKSKLLFVLDDTTPRG